MSTLKRLLSITSYIVTCILLSSVVSCTQEEPEGPVDGTITDKNGPITLELTGHTATTAKFSGTVNLDQFSDLFSLYEEVGIIYSLREDLEVTPLVTFAVPITTLDKNNRFEKTMSGLLHGVKYYYSSYVCSNGIYKFGEVRSFTTDEVEVEVSEPIVTSTTATFKGKAKIDDADLNAIDFGVAWKDNDDFDAGVKEISAEIEADGSFTVVVKDLKMETEYYYTSYVSQVGSEYGEVKKFTTSSADMSVSALNITQTTVTFTGQVSRYAADKDIEYGVLYSTNENLKIGSNGCKSKSLTDYFDADGAYTIKVDGLMNDTKYYYCWYARQGSEYKYGQVQDFTTSFVSVNLSVEPITQTTATFKGNYEQLDGEGFEIGVLYSTASSDLTSNSAKKIILSNKNFSHKISGLKYNTTYYYCYYVGQKGKYTYGSTQEFKTRDVHVEVSVSDVTQTTATFIGQTEITESDAIEVGILYSSNSSLSLSSSLTKKKKLNNGNLSFTAEGLTNNTKYYYKYYIKQGDNYAYGERMDFMTASISATLNQPTVFLTTATFSGKANFSDMSSIEFGILYSTSESLSVNGSCVNKLNVECLSDGEFSCKAEGLTYSTKYYYCYYACQDGSYIYGKVDSFTTESEPVKLSVDSITQTTATFKGSVELTEDGLIEVGMLYSTGNNLTVGVNGVNKQVLSPDSSGNISFKAKGLQYGTTYNYCYYVCQNGKYSYGNVNSFATSSVNMNLSVDAVTHTTATFNGSVELTEEGLIEVGVLYSTGNNLTVGVSGVNKQVLSSDSSGNISFKAEALHYNTAYNYCYYVYQNGKYTYGDIGIFITQNVNINIVVDSVDQTSATLIGDVDFTEKDGIEVGVMYSIDSDWSVSNNETIKRRLTPDASGHIVGAIHGLHFASKYNVCYYVCQNGQYTYGENLTFATLDTNVDLSKNGSANSYIVSQPGQYKIKAVKGNSNDLLGNVAYIDVIWESFGTNSTPLVGDLISYTVSLKDDYIRFAVPSNFKEGNALVAAMDENGTILWSWHIWLTDKPQEHIYPNNAGIMMDRNLGATSASAGDVGALGLMYQWGRKDPFLATSSISNSTIANSTIKWPSVVSSDIEHGTIEYAIANPTTFIGYNTLNDDWLYTGSSFSDNSRWVTSDYDKSIYDPCPVGWRVPDMDVWKDAGFNNRTFDDTNKGITFSIESLSETWYPAAGFRYHGSGTMGWVGNYGRYWSAQGIKGVGGKAYDFEFEKGVVDLYYYRVNAIGQSVRCMKDIE